MSTLSLDDHHPAVSPEWLWTKRTIFPRPCPFQIHVWLFIVLWEMQIDLAISCSVVCSRNTPHCSLCPLHWPSFLLHQPLVSSHLRHMSSQHRLVLALSSEMFYPSLYQQFMHSSSIRGPFLDTPDEVKKWTLVAHHLPHLYSIYYSINVPFIFIITDHYTLYYSAVPRYILCYEGRSTIWGGRVLICNL